MLFSRPRRPVEWLALGLAALPVAARLSSGSELGVAVLTASALGGGLAFGLLSLRGRLAVMSRGVLALGVCLAALAVWGSLRGIGWGRLEESWTRMMVETYRALPSLAGDPATQDRIRQAIAPAMELAPQIARVMPALIGLVALVGFALAAIWQHRIAATPAGRPPARFRDLRFNDHLIWGAIFSLALMLAPLPPDGRTLAANLLVFWAGLYAVRGLAVVAAVLARAPAGVKAVLALLAVEVNPIAFGVCLALGLADTWLDIRRRLPPSAPEGASP
jgi:hypothetical protein